MATARNIVALLKACTKHKDLQKGTSVHADILPLRLLEKNCFVASTLVNMYAKCGALAKAAQVLGELPVRDVVSWSALIAGYAEHGQGEEALKCFYKMQQEGHSPDIVTFICVLKACGSLGAAEKGEQIHEEIVRQGLLENNIVLGNTLVDMYAKSGALDKAERVLKELPIRDVVSWSALIAGYAQQGQGEEALKCYERMQQEGISPNAVSLISVLKACGSLGAADKGKQVHDKIVRMGLLGKDIVLGNALVDMYAKCGALANAAHLLDELPVRNVVSWNALIAGYAQQGQGEEALNCFETMLHEGLFPDRVTFICILKACGSIGAVDKGKQIHGEIVRQGFLGKDTMLGNSLLDMYVKCGAVARAEKVIYELGIRDVVSWNTLIAGYAQWGHNEEALSSFQRMQHDGVTADAVTFTCILKACGAIGAADRGEQVHNEILRLGLLGKDVVLGTCVVDMYVKCGALAKAAQAFVVHSARNAVTWNALIAGYMQQGQGEEALKCFEQMQCEGFSPNSATFTCILKACACIGAADKGEQIHHEMVTQGLLGKDIVLDTTLVDMYAKCGATVKAAEVLSRLPFRDVVSWNALIAGYAQQGKAAEALKCFKQMQHEGLSPDTVNLLSLLSACSRAALLVEGQMCFANMSTLYGITPDVEHHTCMVDLFGHAGEFEQALAVIKKLRSSEHLPFWHALLGACQEWGNVNIGRLAFNKAVQVEKVALQLMP